MRALLLSTAVLALLACPAPALAHRPRPRHPPVVVVAFDEFNVDWLLDRPGHVDAARFPWFAWVARHAHWFVDAQSVHDFTGSALPAILDGRYPVGLRPSTWVGHPQSLFTLFAAHGYRVHGDEAITRVCPPWICRHWRGPVLDARRASRFRSFVRSLRPRGRRLWFHHVLLPHGPDTFLPSGQSYGGGVSEWRGGIASPRGYGDAFLTLQSQERRLLQLGFVDRLLGGLVRRMRRVGLYDRALLVLTADHGMAFDRGVFDRRLMTRDNIDEIGPVPLFVKLPHQRRGRIHRSLARTVDIVPTIASALHWRLPWRVGGRNALGRALRPRHLVTMMRRWFDGYVTLPLSAWERRRAGNIRRRRRLFGRRWSSVWRIGPNRGLLDHRLSTLRLSQSNGVRARIDDPARFRRVSLRRSRLPVWITGRLLGGGPSATRAVAVALNGRIAAVGRSFHLRVTPTSGVLGPTEAFSTFVPEHALRAGRDRVVVFQVLSGRRLRRLGSAP